MQYKQGSVSATVLAVQDFLAKYADRLGPVASSGARQKLDEIAITLDTHGREQEVKTLAAKGATIRRAEARRALINEHMHPIAQVAAVELPNFADLATLHMPRLNVNDSTLIQKARAMAAEASNHSEVFSAGLADQNFVGALEQAADSLVTALKVRTDSAATREKATASLATDYRVARRRIRVLDRLVTPRIKADAGLLAEWNRVKQVAKKAGVPRTIVKPDDIAPAKPPVTPPVTLPVTPPVTTTAPATPVGGEKHAA